MSIYSACRFTVRVNLQCVSIYSVYTNDPTKRWGIFVDKVHSYIFNPWLKVSHNFIFI